MLSVKNPFEGEGSILAAGVLHKVEVLGVDVHGPGAHLRDRWTKYRPYKERKSCERMRRMYRLSDTVQEASAGTAAYSRLLEPIQELTSI